MFEHEFFPRETIPSITTKWGRLYKTPIGKLPSVTTVLHYSPSWFDKTYLKEWRERVGKEKAEHISNQAKTRGTAIHKIAEKYLDNDPDYAKDEMPINIDDFKKLKKILDQKVQVIYGLEHALYSRKLMTAGKVDLVAAWGEREDKFLWTELAVVDFKTSKRKKAEKDILAYFIQATAYALMFQEMYHTPPIEKIVVIILVDHEQPQIFEKEAKAYYNIVEAIFPIRELING